MSLFAILTFCFVCLFAFSFKFTVFPFPINSFLCLLFLFVILLFASCFVTSKMGLWSEGREQNIRLGIQFYSLIMSAFTFSFFIFFSDRLSKGIMHKGMGTKYSLEDSQQLYRFSFFSISLFSLYCFLFVYI